MTVRKKESALGRGLDALIRPDFADEDKNEKKSNKESNTNNSNNVKNIDNKNKFSKSKKNIIKNKASNISEIESKNEIKPTIDQTLVENVILDVRKNPRITLWSAKSAAVLRLLKKTKPEFSISKEASYLIEEAVKDKYPDLWDEFKDREI